MTIPAPLEDWQPAISPHPWRLLCGKYVQLQPLAIAHAEGLFAAYSHSDGESGWDYLPYGPFDLEGFTAWVTGLVAKSDPTFVAICDGDTGRPVGMASFLRITPDIGVIEVGHIHFSPLLRGTRGATEAMFLMMRWVFQQGYRRYEWKCNALNAGSRRAAARLGFSYEGTFYQASIAKGRNRDTAWFAMLDWQWSRLEQAFSHWLSDANFDAQGQQRESLSALTQPILYAKDTGYQALGVG